MRKYVLFGICTILSICMLIATFCGCASQEESEELTYPVVDMTGDNTEQITESENPETLYIVSTQSSECDSSKRLIIRYFNEDSDSEDSGDSVFLEPIFEDGTCVEERIYPSEQDVANDRYSSAEGGSYIIEKVGKLASETDKDNPAILVYKDSFLYCIAGAKAYAIASDYSALPENITITKLACSENTITYAVNPDGTFKPA